MPTAPRPVMIAVTAPLLLAAAALMVGVALGAIDADALCPDGWKLTAEVLPPAMVIASAWTMFAAIRFGLRAWAVGATAVTCGLILWFFVASDLATKIDTEPDAAPHAQQCRSASALGVAPATQSAHSGDGALAPEQKRQPRERLTGLEPREGPTPRSRAS